MELWVLCFLTVSSGKKMMQGDTKNRFSKAFCRFSRGPAVAHNLHTELYTRCCAFDNPQSPVPQSGPLHRDPHPWVSVGSFHLIPDTRQRP